MSKPIEHAPRCWADPGDLERTAFPAVTVSRCPTCGAVGITRPVERPS